MITKRNIITIAVIAANNKNQNQRKMYIFSLIILRGNKHSASIVSMFAEGPYL
jgi:hypothetical protein